MKKILIPFLLLVFMFSYMEESSAQRRGKKKRRTKEKTEEQDDKRSTRDDEEEDYGPSGIKEKLNTEIKLGNLNFFGNILNISMKSNVGYKFNNTFSAGLGGKFDYYYRSVPGPGDEGFFSYGGLVYARAKITQQLYAQVEYSAFNTAFTLPRKTYLYPSAGLGYMYDGFNWRFGAEVLVPLEDEVRDFFGIVEYWINFSHNF